MTESIKKKDWIVMYLENLSNSITKLCEYYANGGITKEMAYKYLSSTLFIESMKLRALAKQDPELREILPKRPDRAVAGTPSPNKEKEEGNKNPSYL